MSERPNLKQYGVLKYIDELEQQIAELKAKYEIVCADAGEVDEKLMEAYEQIAELTKQIEQWQLSFTLYEGEVLTAKSRAKEIAELKAQLNKQQGLFDILTETNEIGNRNSDVLHKLLDKANERIKELKQELKDWKTENEIALRGENKKPPIVKLTS